MGYVCLICAAVVIARVADAEDRNPLVWSLGTIVAGYGIASLGWGLLVGSGLGMIAVFTVMFVMNVIKG